MKEMTQDEWHEQAMGWEDVATKLQWLANKNDRIADLDGIKTCHEIAAECEEKAAGMSTPDQQPTYSVLYRSAAAIALSAGQYQKAIDLAVKGCVDGTPMEIAFELGEIAGEAARKMGEEKDHD